MSFEHLLPLVSTLASEIIPDLVREHVGLGEHESLDEDTSSAKMISRCKHPKTEVLSAQEIDSYAEAICHACIEMSSEDLVLYALNLFEQGLHIEVFYLDIIPPSIRLLHYLWEQDQISFLDVTTATWSIKRLIFALSPEFIMPNESSVTPGSNRFQVLVTSAAGAKHTLGPLIVSQYLQRKGWSVLPGFDHQEKTLLEMVTNNWVDLYCISISVSQQVPGLKAWISKVKSKSQNPGIQFLVGGPLIALQPELIDELGADLICKTVREVHTLGMKLVSVHRKARKLNQLNAIELTNNAYLDGLEVQAQKRETKATKRQSQGAPHGGGVYRESKSKEESRLTC